jgi:hypothetical protein
MTSSLPKQTNAAVAVHSARPRAPATLAHLKELEDVAQRLDIQVIHTQPCAHQSTI